MLANRSKTPKLTVDKFIGWWWWFQCVRDSGLAPVPSAVCPLKGRMCQSFLVPGSGILGSCERIRLLPGGWPRRDRVSSTGTFSLLRSLVLVPDLKQHWNWLQCEWLPRLLLSQRIINLPLDIFSLWLPFPPPCLCLLFQLATVVCFLLKCQILIEFRRPFWAAPLNYWHFWVNREA